MSAGLPSGPGSGRHVPARYSESWLALQEALGGRYVLEAVLGRLRESADIERLIE